MRRRWRHEQSGIRLGYLGGWVDAADAASDADDKLSLEG
jgi:hypothetical protein